MSKRNDYYKQYNTKNREKRLEYFRRRYKKDRKELLTKAKKHYILNREDILAKNKMKSLAFRGHANSIWSAIKKYARKWNLPICTFEEFYNDWTMDDPTYQQLYDAWVASDYSEFLSPVVMRQVKKNGFVPSNLRWDIKNNYSWWNEDATVFKRSEEELEEKQKIYNRRNKEWRKKVREQWKAKQKEKNK